MAKITIANNKTRLFVNFVSEDKKRISGSSGSYVNQAGERVFQGSVTVFFDEKFDGTVPAKGDFVEVSGDMAVQTRKDKPEELNATYNVRFKNQVTQLEKPVKKAAAPADGGSDDI
ncbi:hypothetical protein KTD31_00895 [Burkholderia multivorans]|jgi:hypothetical protein|uniref:hypothetical protein n=1 Tax=Burkholderia multivorans TaxID=87883 RepID=UPI001C243308|nr:hypothetical protein [Burkholderia multivorans]MBU9199958.1 hypothetical protein [Burkholderia multivorans]MDN8078923.1 hypothetical protein [Burkholderia multivorans]